MVGLDHEAFSDRTRALIEQYAARNEPLAGHTLNGEPHAWERTSVTSPGLAVAYRAYLFSLGRRAGAGHRRFDR